MRTPSSGTRSRLPARARPFPESPVPGAGRRETIENGETMKRRAVVTGMGCVSPNGIGREAFATALRSGRSGVGKVSLFDPEGLAVTIAAEVKDF